MNSNLSPRQKQALLLALHDKPNRVIAQEMGLSPKTVEKHIDASFSKLGVHSRLHALSAAIKAGLIVVDDWLAAMPSDKPRRSCYAKKVVNGVTKLVTYSPELPDNVKHAGFAGL